MFLVGFDMYFSIWQRIMGKTTRNINITSVHKLHTGIYKYDAVYFIMYYVLCIIIIIIIIIIYEHYLFQKLNFQLIFIAIAFIALCLSRLKSDAHF